MTDSALILRIVLRWFLVLLSCSAVICTFGAFSGAFTKKKWSRIVFVGILMAISITAYALNHRHPDVVYMQEDILYVKPSSDEE